MKILSSRRKKAIMRYILMMGRGTNMYALKLERLKFHTTNLEAYIEKETIELLEMSPEYRDTYDMKTGKIKIIKKVHQGTLKHVLNCIDIIHQLEGLGIFDKFPINREWLMKVSILHDIGKQQPKLEVGEIIDPKNVFEDGKIHAAKSAEMALEKYKIEENLYWIIYYHHHMEKELQENTILQDSRWLLHYRLFKMIDGLSAALTRRDAEITIDLVEEGLMVFEDNKNRDYSGAWRYNLHTGSRERVRSFFE